MELRIGDICTIKQDLNNYTLGSSYALKIMSGYIKQEDRINTYDMNFSSLHQGMIFKVVYIIDDMSDYFLNKDSKRIALLYNETIDLYTLCFANIDAIYSSVDVDMKQRRLQMIDELLDI